MVWDNEKLQHEPGANLGQKVSFSGYNFSNPADECQLITCAAEDSCISVSCTVGHSQYRRVFK